MDQVKNWNIPDRHITFPYAQPNRPWDYETKRDINNPLINSDMFYYSLRPSNWDESIDRWWILFITMIASPLLDPVILLSHFFNWVMDELNILFSGDKNPYLYSQMAEN